MSQSITQIKESLIGMSHSGSLNKVRNVEALFERAAETLLSKIDPVETERTQALAQVVHDDIYNYSLPSDYKKVIDLFPQDNRGSLDDAQRTFAGRFDLRKMIADKKISIEGSEGSKIIRINWRSRQGVVLNEMNSVTANGTWSAVGSATGVTANSIFKVSGSASIEFDLVASGDGIKNTTMTAVDLTDEDEVADVFAWVYLGSTTNVTSISAIWGNDLTTKFWTSTAQTTQADGTALKIGWNLLKFPWSTATETGTVAPATVDSFQITVAASAALNNIRVDNIIFSIGRNFDIKYNSKFIFKNSAGTLLSRPASDDDTVILDGTSLQLYRLEALKAIAQQVEGEDSTFDISYANREMHGDPTAADPVARQGLYSRYRVEYPSQAKKPVGSWSRGPRFKR